MKMQFYSNTRTDKNRQCITMYKNNGGGIGNQKNTASNGLWV